jgi:hypothetical protein
MKPMSKRKGTTCKSRIKVVAMGMGLGGSERAPFCLTQNRLWTNKKWAENHCHSIKRRG